MSNLINRREALQEQVDDILQYLDEYLHPIVSPEHWSVYSELHDMVSKLQSAQPEIIHCENCEHWKSNHLCESLSRFGTFETPKDFFCGYGKEK